MKTITTHVVLVLLIACFYSCNSHRPVNYSKTYSQGFYHDDNIYFLLDYDVWKKGRTIWFIMPMELPRKVYFREIYLYSYQPDMNHIDKLGVLRKDFVPRVDVKYTKFTNDNDNIVFGYFAGSDEAHNRVIDLFIWDSKTRKFLDTGYENPIAGDNPLHQKYFSNYKSPWSDNPGIINISRLKNETLQHIPIEAYGLPEKW